MTVVIDGTAGITSPSIDLTVTPLPVVDGGTGATTSAGALSNLGAVNKAGDTMTGALNSANAVSVASAATTDIGAAASNNVTVTGTTTITALGTIAAGATRQVTFSGALILTHNATSLILPGAANITTAAGDVAQFVSLGAGNWKCANYAKASGQAVVASAAGVTTVDGVSGAVTLSALPAFTASKAQRGYQKLPSGLIIQWGYSATWASVTFPIAFNTAYSANATYSGANHEMGISSLTATTLTPQTNGNTSAFFWMATGI